MVAARVLPVGRSSGSRAETLARDGRTRNESSRGSRSAARTKARTRRTIATPTRQFSLLEITSGLPDDSREADERAAERRLRDLRGRVKAARALVATTPGLAETLQRDWQKAARFYARFEITETRFRHGVQSPDSPSEGDPLGNRTAAGPTDGLPDA